MILAILDLLLFIFLSIPWVCRQIWPILRIILGFFLLWNLWLSSVTAYTDPDKTTPDMTSTGKNNTEINFVLPTQSNTTIPAQYRWLFKTTISPTEKPTMPNKNSNQTEFIITIITAIIVGGLTLLSLLITLWKIYKTKYQQPNSSPNLNMRRNYKTTEDEKEQYRKLAAGLKIHNKPVKHQGKYTQVKIKKLYFILLLSLQSYKKHLHFFKG